MDSDQAPHAPTLPPNAPLHEWLAAVARSRLPKLDAAIFDLDEAVAAGNRLPGLVSFVTCLRSGGLRTGLVLTGRNARLLQDGPAFGDLFDAVVDGSALGRSLPDPDLLVQAADALHAAPSRSVVFAREPGGVQAAGAAGMLTVGVGDPSGFSAADLVISGYDVCDAALFTGESTDRDLCVAANGFDPERVEVNGSRFIVANGNFGYRGTLEEHLKAHLVGCTMSGIFDRAGDSWREPVNAPNGLYTLASCNDEQAAVTARDPVDHRQVIDMRRGVHARESVFDLAGISVALSSERFASLADVHLLAMDFALSVDAAGHLAIETGIDADVWDINGPHLAQLTLACRDGILLAIAGTNEGDRVVVAEGITWRGDHGVVSSKDRILRHFAFEAEPGRTYAFQKFVAIFSSRDGAADPVEAAVAAVTRAMRAGYLRERLKHAQQWHERWARAGVRIDGDPDAQLGLRYSIFQLMQATPSHTDRASVPGRGLAGQMYKGACFWDTEVFMLPFFTYTQPGIARNLVMYRCNTLAGARAKAAEYGYQGAFYAWESQETGEDACTLFNITDVFTSRPVRTYFRDKQIHISADVAWAVWQYYLITGDQSILFDGGAEVILECARFYLSYAYFKQDKHRYELVDVTGPDEYHERVSNNAFTNAMAAFCLQTALDVVDLLRRLDKDFTSALLDRIAYGETLHSIKDMCAQLYVPAPDPTTLLIEQFDGYYQLEDLSLAELLSRIKIPSEYLGGGSGLATTTQILKQADVVAMLHMFRRRYSREVKTANWTYYEPRTEQGSTLSTSVYATVAADIGRPEWAYPYFLTTANVDLKGAYKRYVGTLYIGGTHPAANGGAWMAAVLGFGGLDFDGQVACIVPALPAQWRSLCFTVFLRGQQFEITVDRHQVRIVAAIANDAAVEFRVNEQRFLCDRGQCLTVAIATSAQGGAERTPPA